MTLSGIGSAFGYHTAYTVPTCLKEAPGENIKRNPVSAAEVHATQAKTHNMCVALGYIPIVGIFTGAILYMFAVNGERDEDEESRAYWNTTFVRACCQFIGFGVLFLIPDLIASVVRVVNYFIESRRGAELN